MNINGNSGLLWYKVIDNSKTKQLADFEKDPVYARARDHFIQKAPDLKSVDDLMNDRRSLEVVLGAFQLEDQVDSRALIKKIMSEDIEDNQSLVNRLLEPRYRKLAEFAQPLAQGIEPFSDAEYVDTIVQAYKTNEFEKRQEQINPSLRMAMYFERLAPNLTDINSLMADQTIKEVVRVGLGLPDSFGGLDFDQQKARLEKSIDIEDFKDPQKMDKFIERFLIQYDVNNGIGTTDPALALFNGGAATGVDILGTAFGSSGGGLNVLI